MTMTILTMLMVMTMALTMMMQTRVVVVQHPGPASNYTRPLLRFCTALYTLLYKYYTNIIQIRYNYYTNIMQISYRYYTRPLLRFYTGFGSTAIQNTVQISFKYHTNISAISFNHCVVQCKVCTVQCSVGQVRVQQQEQPLLPPICPNLTVGPHCFCLNADIHSDDEDADEETDDDIHLDDEDAGHHHLCFHNRSIFSVFDLNN